MRAVSDLLRRRADVIVDERAQALERSNAHDGAEASHGRFARPLELEAVSVEKRDLVSLIDHATQVANGRFDAGFDIREVQRAFHLLEESIWENVV